MNMENHQDKYLSELYNFLIGEISRERDLYWRITHFCVLLIGAILGLKLTLFQSGNNLVPYRNIIFHYILPFIILLICLLGVRTIMYVGMRSHAKMIVLLGIEKEMGLNKLYKKHLPKWIFDEVKFKLKPWKMFEAAIWFTGVFASYLISEGRILIVLILFALGFTFHLTAIKQSAKYETTEDLLRHC